MIREIEMDHAMGKIPAEDFEMQRAALVARGIVRAARDRRPGRRAAAEPADGDLDAAIEAASWLAAAQPAAGTAGFCTTLRPGAAGR